MSDQFMVLGLNHRTAPIEVRERAAVSLTQQSEVLRRIKALKGIQESLVLSTCNRVEIYAWVENPEKGQAALEGFFKELAGSKTKSLKSHLYAHRGEDAIRHAIRVGAGLDAMVFGETQVFGQMKEAFAAAAEARGIGATMNGLFSRMFSVVKRVHAETGIGQMPGSVSSVAVDLAEKIFNTLAGRTILLVGAGKMSELTAKSLASRGAAQVSVVNRTFETAQELARLVGGVAVPFEQLGAQVEQADIVVASTAATSWILRREEIAQVMPRRRFRPMFLIDLGVPRNIEPAVDKVEGVYLYNIDDLQGIAHRYAQERQKFAGRAEAIVQEGVSDLTKWLKGLAVSPMIAELQQVADRIRREELGKVIKKLPVLSEAEAEELEAFSKMVVGRLLKGPIHHLKQNGTSPHAESLREMVRAVFTSNGHSSETPRALRRR